MNKTTVWVTLLLFVCMIFGYIIGMMDYRLMINTAHTCTCWIKFAGLWAFVGLVIAYTGAYWSLKYIMKGKNEPVE